MEPVDLLILGGVVVTMNPRMPVIAEGVVAVRGDRIAAVGPRNALGAHFSPTEIVDASDCAVIPGLINGHTHAAMTIFRGLADDLPLMEWLEGYIFPAEAHLKGEWVRWGTRLACAEMLLGGTTTFCDMYLFEEEVAEAARESGIRAVVGEVLYDFPSPNYGPLEEGLRYTEALISRWQGDALIRTAVEPHATFTCSPELLKRARSLANEYEVPLIIHVSETREELERVRQQYGDTPVRHLDRLGILDGPTVAAHAVQVDEEELAILLERGVGVVHNPESNMKLASGVAPVPRMLELGIPVGLGTDGCASNNDLDLFREMDTAAKLHKIHDMDPIVMSAQEVLEMATIGGAKALGLEDEVGTLEPGKRADIVTVDLRQPHLTPLYHVVSHLAYAARASDVRTVIVNGNVVVEEGSLRTLSLEHIFQAVGEIAGEIHAIVGLKNR
jgi:5-methylthioadenosine/S-adenosylhomocysteine deaminase